MPHFKVTISNGKKKLTRTVFGYTEQKALDARGEALVAEDSDFYGDHWGLADASETGQTVPEYVAQEGLTECANGVYIKVLSVTELNEFLMILYFDSEHKSRALPVKLAALTRAAAYEKIGRFCNTEGFSPVTIECILIEPSFSIISLDDKKKEVKP